MVSYSVSFYSTMFFEIQTHPNEMFHNSSQHTQMLTVSCSLPSARCMYLKTERTRMMTQWEVFDQTVFLLVLVFLGRLCGQGALT